MSITFFLKKHGHVSYQARNNYYDPSKPNDDFFNPKTYPKPIFFEINLSNVNALRMLEVLGFKAVYSGEISSKEFENLLKKIKDLEKIHQLNSYVLERLKDFDTLVRIAIALGDDIVWG
jgi:hypothetical protein